MRMMARVSMPVDAGNQAVLDGSLPKVLEQVADQWHPEAMYFTAVDGQRSAYIVFDLPDSASIPVFAEPFFVELHAHLTMSPVMNTDDLREGLAQLR